jgi:Domain of unknown function (DUF1877)
LLCPGHNNSVAIPPNSKVFVMSVEYLAYQVSPFLIQKLEEKGHNVFNLFWEADLVEEFEELQGYVEDGDLNLEILGEDAVAIFEEAKSFYDSDKITIDVDGKWAEPLNLVLTGCASFEASDFLVSNELDGEPLLLVSALTGCHSIENMDMPVFYMLPLEVQEIANTLPQILNENLDERWKRLRHKIRTGEDYFSADEAYEFLKEQLIPFYDQASQNGYGVLVVLSV